jgi:16S rRNA (adenine1518-N6/adenine1519-N6)-dimethyltransferase
MSLHYKKSYGQHILASDSIAEVLVGPRGIAPTNKDTVLEIGPGTGMLTKHILRHNPKRLIAVEKDPEMVVHLKDYFKEDLALGQLTLRETDALSYTPEQDGLIAGEYLLAANLPYYITGALLRRYLSLVAHPSKMSVMVQREVAERIVQEQPSSILSVSVRAYGTPNIVRIVKPGSFVPPPSVDSAILTITNISKKQFTKWNVSEEHFFNILKEGFKQKRKQLKNNLEELFENTLIQKAFAECGIEQKARAEDLKTEAWFRLAQELH